MSDITVAKRTGRSWAEWVRVLDEAHAAKLSHREIAAHVSSLGTPNWWTQMVTVGYERVRGLRDKSQGRHGGYEASKTRTFAVPVETLFNAFANARARRRWLPVTITVRRAIPHKSMRWTWDDSTRVLVAFLPKGQEKTTPLRLSVHPHINGFRLRFTGW